MDEKIKQFITSLSSSEKDGLFRRLWLDHVKTDVIQFCEENDVAYNDEDFIDKVAMSFVCGKYDCNLSYWDNISNLVADTTEEVTAARFDI